MIGGGDKNSNMMQWSNSLATDSPTTTDAAAGGVNKMDVTAASAGGNNYMTMCVHPLLWGREDVQSWLKWCINEFSFTDVKSECFSMNGKALILLKKEDFIERAPYSGDVLYNILQKLLETQNKNSMPNTAGTNELRSNPAIMSMLMQPNFFYAQSLLQRAGFPANPFGVPISSPLGLTSLADTMSTSKMSDTIQAGTLLKPMSPPSTSTSPSSFHMSCKEEKKMQMPPHLSSQSSDESIRSSQFGVVQPQKEPLNLQLSNEKPKSDCRLLWEFISKLLKDSQYTNYIRWENKEDYTFRIVNPAQLSRMWGIQKNRTNMTYEKLSRALRYYYRMDIIEKVPGRRLTYRFMRAPHEIRRGQRGAKPGVPRKSKSVDHCEEEIQMDEDYESVALYDGAESEFGSDSESRNRLSSTEQENNDLPMDLISHKRNHSGSEGYPQEHSPSPTVIQQTQHRQSVVVEPANNASAVTAALQLRPTNGSHSPTS